MTTGCPIIVFAKAPVPGQAKTRLGPVLGAGGAAALAERLLAHALAQAVSAALGPVELCATPDLGHPAFDRARTRWPLQTALQGDGDLGERMSRALSRHLATPPAAAPRPRALLIGTDAPALDAARLRAAAAALDDADAVLVPALDGGYVLVGLARPAPALFQDIAWSTSSVLAQTRVRAAAAGLRLAELPPVADIDEPADLAHLPAHWRDVPGRPAAAGDGAVAVPPGT